MRKIHFVAAVAVLGISASAFGATSWGAMANGMADNFSWANGQNGDNNYFGAPSYFGGDDLWFLADNFDVAASNSNTLHSKSDTMDVDLTAMPTRKFTNITLHVFGDYTITDGGAPGGNGVSAMMDITGSAGGAYVPPSPWGGSDVNFSANSGQSDWSSMASVFELSFVAPDVTSMHLHVEGNTVAFSDGEGGSASMTVAFQLLQVSIVTIPEPATMSLLALGGLAAVVRRRR